MDAIILGFLVGFSVVMFWLSLKGRKMGWKFIGFMGAFLAGMTWLILSNDADMTFLGTVITSANGNFVSDFNILTWIPGFLSLGEFMVTLYRTVS